LSQEGRRRQQGRAVQMTLLPIWQQVEQQSPEQMVVQFEAAEADRLPETRAATVSPSPSPR